jgi:cephalosporin hydroxylase
MQNRFIEKVEGIVTENKGFTENWYSNDQLVELAETCKAVRDLSGDVIEIGCWEGKSTCIIANALLGDTVIAVDTWKGNLSEGDNHPSVIAAQQRDVLSRFTENVAKFTKGNVQPVVSDCFEFLKQHKQKVKFAHLDAGHDYASVKNAIEMLKPLLVRGAVLCGDDFMSANATRADLGGGVEKAVTEACPGFVSKSNFWYWINK